MKKAILSSVLMVLCILALAQVPQSFNYQVVVRDGTSNNPLVNQNVSFKMSILKGSISGESQYSELHSANTGSLGIVNLVIGNGTGKVGSISSIDWGADSYFLKVELDKGDAIFVDMGTIQLLSVPYAMHAKTVANYPETDPIFGAWDKSTGINIIASQVSDFQTSVTNNAEVLANTAKNSYPAADATKLASIADGANVGVVPNAGITGATKTKITYDTKGLVTAGTDATTADIAASTDKNYVTDAQLTVIGNTSGLNTGDYTHPTGDGNLHVPATGTTNDGKVLTAGATAGSLSWESPTTGSSSLTIGDSYGGGKIFWLDASGQHGLIASTADQSTGSTWTILAFYSIATNAVRDGVYGGLSNTERIIIQAGNGSYAASLCSNYQGGNYADWYLPSKYELNLLYLQRDKVGGFASAAYWSSYGSSGVWYQNFNDGQGNYGSKDGSYYVRAIRAF